MDKLYTDHQLFVLIAAGDEAAFTQLFRHYDQRVYAFVLKMIRSETLAEEITQEIFLRLWMFRARLPNVEQPEAYIISMASNYTIDQIKKLLNERLLLHRLSQETNGGSRITQEQLNFRESQGLLQQIIDRLPDQQRRVFLLSRNEGLNYEEIGERMGISKNTVRNHLVEALKSIRQHLDIQESGRL